MASAPRFVCGQPSPPISTDGEPGSGPDASLEPCNMHPALYEPKEHPEGTAMPVSDVFLHPVARVDGTQSFSYGEQPDFQSPASWSQLSAPSTFRMSPASPVTLDEPTPIRSDSSPPAWLSADAKSASATQARVIRRTKLRRRLPKKEKEAASDSFPKMTAPLSELTKHLIHIPLRDMEAHVHRPIEVRRREVAKKTGKIARPMNSFMLYRSAYADRIKDLYGQNNHQVVSKASGASWKIENPVVRNRFEQLALIERDNHAKAHPEYKFAPDKDKKRKRADEPDDPESQFDSSSSFVSKRAKSSDMESFYDRSRSSTPFDPPPDASLLPAEEFAPTTWQLVSSPPSAQEIASGGGPQVQYLPVSPYSGVIGPEHTAEDPRLARLGMRDCCYDDSASTLTGLPGGAHHELLRPQSTAPSPRHPEDGQVDPQLLSYSAAPVYAASPYTLWQEEPLGNHFQVVSVPSLPQTHALAYHTEPAYAPGVATLTADGGSWEIVSHDACVVEVGRDFNPWFESHPATY